MIEPNQQLANADDDHGLIAAIAKHDTQAFEAIYDRYAGLIYRLGLRMLHSNELAEEIVQETFWRVWRRGASYDSGRGRAAAWLLGIAHNLCIDELRRQRARPHAVYEDDEHPIIRELPDQQADVPAQAWAHEQQQVVAAALGQLPLLQRQAIALAYYGGLSHQQIAAFLDRPLGTIKTRIRLGMRKLGAVLDGQQGWMGWAS